MERTIFLSITDAEREEMVAAAILGREREILGYEINIENYEAIVANPSTSPEFSKRLTDLLKTENAEREKSLGIYAALKTHIPAARIVAAIAAAKAKAALP